MITKYPDGSSYATKQRQDNFIFKVNSYEDLWHLNQVVDAYNSYGSRPCILIPCLIDAQADRRFHGGESYGLKLVLKFLKKMKADFRFFHPHNPVLVKYELPRCTILENHAYVLDCIKDMGLMDTVVNNQRADICNTVLLSPDAGAFKTVIELADAINWQGETYAASKSRKWEDGKSKLVQSIDRQDFGGKDIIIVDDLCIYGGTFKGLAKLLRERNVGKLYLIVSHMTVQDLGEDPVTNYFDTVYTTNSKYDFYTYQNNGTQYPTNLKIMNIF